MGNCLKTNSSDDISLLRNHDINNIREPSEEQSVQSLHINHSTDYGTLELSTRSTVLGSNISGGTETMGLQYNEEDHMKIAKRLGLIHHLPIGKYGHTSGLNCRECVICMVEFEVDEPVRYLPCMHIYHVHCIDGWLLRSLTCPSCLEPVDAALLSSYETT